ncbi:MAG: hypothetical protein RR605_06680 [Acinetobacter sp.]
MKKKIIIDDLKYNLSKAISEIFIHTKFNYLTKNSFCNDVKKYNYEHNNSLKYSKFLNNGLIQEINGIIKTIEHNKVPLNEKNYVEFIKNYKPKTSEPSICKKKLESILKNYHIPLNYLENYTNTIKNTIYLNYNFFREIYCLTDKICYHLWFVLKGNNIQNFSRIIQYEGMWIKAFHHLLSEKEYLEYYNYVKLFISKQSDLNTNKFEVFKTIADYQPQRHLNQVTDNLLFNEFKYAYYPILFLNNLKYSGSEYYDLNYQPTRQLVSKFLSTLDFEHEESFNYLMSLTTQKKSLYLTNLAINTLNIESKNKTPFLINSNPPIAPHIFNNIFSIQKINNGKIILDNYSFENKNYAEKNIKLDLLLNWLFNLFKESNLEVRKISNFDRSVSVYRYSNDLKFTISLSKIVCNLYKKCFSSNSAINYHTKFREKINQIPKMISSYMDQFDESYTYILVNLFRNELTYKVGSHHHAFIQPNIALFHLLTDIYSLLPKNYNNTKNLISIIFIEQLNFFFNSKTLKTFISNNKWDIKEVTYGVSTFAFESVEWNNVLEIIISSGDLGSLYNEIYQNVSIETDESKFHEHNLNQKKRIIFLFKIITLSYIKSENLNLKEDLYHKVIDLCLTFKKDDPSNKLLNIFDYKQGYISSGNDIHYRDTRAIFYDFINSLDEIDENINFIYTFIKESKDLNFLIEANNNINSEKFKVKIQEHIKKITLEDFLENVYTIDEIEKTIINSINSESNYNFARDLLPKVIEHYENRNYKKIEAINFKKNIELLLAFKDENLSRIEEIRNENDTSREVKQKALYYRSIYPSYYQKDWDETLKRIENLPKDLDYQFQKFRCTILHIQKTRHEKIETFKSFEKYLEENNNIKWNSNILEYYKLLKLIPLSLMNRNTDFLNIFNNLNNRLKYNEETISYIYEFFVKNDLLIDSYKFIMDANHYYINTNNRSEILEEIINSHDNHQTNSQIKKTLALLPNINYKELPKVYPLESSNSKFINYQFFIILKIVSALKLLVDKRNAIKKEDEYNDLLLILLKFKFSDFGWSFEDQTRSGTSSTKKGAGEIDLAISHKNNKIALIEAFRLAGKDITVTQEHSHKTSLYAKNLNTYYMLIYFIGDSKNFNSTWNSYQGDFLSTSFEDGFRPVNQNFEELTRMFDDVNRFHIAKTQHENNITYFHIMVDFSL